MEMRSNVFQTDANAFGGCRSPTADAPNEEPTLGQRGGNAGLVGRGRVNVWSSRDFQRYCPLAEPVEHLLREALGRLGLSAGAYHRILKISRTIADLDGAEQLSVGHVSEAIQYRSLDRRRAAAV
jgi:predicted ATPase with chaperone activity